jgi:hypothetical protein
MNMVRIPILIIAFYLSIAAAFSQTDSASYENRKLKVEEVDFVTSYYKQDGNNAAVTGGVGSEHLTDFATTIDVRLTKTDRKSRLNTYTFELGIDTYSSASSDKIDPSTVSSASSADQRIYPSLTWSRFNDAKGTTIGANFSVSSEYDYLSIGGGVNLFKNSKDKSQEFGIKLSTYQDFVTMIYPIEQRSGKEEGAMKSRNTYSTTMSFAQIVNTRLQLLFLFDLAYQDGYLSLPFNRVYFDDSSVGIENLPGKRFKYPISMRANYFLGDRFVIRSFYRYYQDDWGLKSHTAEIETSVKITPFVSVSPFYRFYKQSAIDYFAAYKQHQVGEQYFSSDYDLSAFNSHFAGIGFRMLSENGILGIKQFNLIEVRYGHYTRQTGLVSDVVSLNARFK